MTAVAAVPERFWSKVDKHGPVPAYAPSLGPCWIWTAAQITGYGIFWMNGHNVFAHRLLYEAERGSVPDGLQLDHLCRIRNCVRPDHLEPVTALENQLRGNGFAAVNLAKTHCPKGHQFNRIPACGRRRPRRACSTCRNDARRAKRRLMRELAS